ncbi:MAG: nucleoside-diphosphate kinase [bacterium]|nr:nucleoside-diphosphate kinase [bacterium]
MIEKTLVLVKPDGVQRNLVGKIISRFEDAGLKIAALKMVWIDKNFAKKHYTEDISKRLGEHIRQYNVDFLSEGPVVAIVLEGIHAIENVRKIVGSTEPKTAPPGTIRGDFCHSSYSFADKKKRVVRNVIHASSSKEDAESEMNLWFSDKEVHDYKKKDWELMH